ncbi:hypothetical protein TCAL_16154 [Tigriopus californicus]|uniref:G-protein coupled receptors family 1 profile domain-containing protein n=1 Tax=Tigriopus californicus TaxID=6832 RepID=A0A553P3S4_TIGCA|nr:uncharacterized protein LOC131883120 [Tigriopus californicus]TRY72338.1 hypothetical protein TCAL_16154 [Tigriopus californicus]
MKVLEDMADYIKGPDTNYTSNLEESVNDDLQSGSVGHISPSIPTFTVGGDASGRVMFPDIQVQNVVILSLVLTVGLLANFLALPVILFRRTKFGNGLFAVLILCLTLSDVAVILFSVLGSLVVEASNLLWGGTPGSCKVYHWLSAWLSGLSAYLLVAIIGMVMVKTTNSCLQRLRDCRWLLLALLVASGLLALPELFIRSTVDLGLDGAIQQDICILGAKGTEYGFYVAFRLTLRHVVPAILVIMTILRPETKLSKRVSHLFFGHLSTPCACGDGGAALGLPHECPTMQTAMLKNSDTSARESPNPAANGHVINTVPPTTISTSRPDLVMDSEPINGHNGHTNGLVSNGNGAKIRFIRKGGGRFRKLLIQPEDPHRRRYKLFLSIHFLLCTLLNFTLDLAFQIQSAESSQDLVWTSTAAPLSVEYTNHSENLATAIYTFAHLQQIGDPIIFLLAEFAFG